MRIPLIELLGKSLPLVLSSCLMETNSMNNQAVEYSLDSFEVGDFDFDAGIVLDPENEGTFTHLPLDVSSFTFSMPFGSSVPDVSVLGEETENIPLFDDLLPISKAPRIEESDSEEEVSTSNQLSLTASNFVHDDLRRSFSKMLMNTINSAQFEHIQEFAHTFMLPNAPFFSYNAALRPEVQEADIIDCVGPRMFSHYVLGCFVMHPDMYISLGETQVITSSGWPGTRLVMQVEYTLTKTHNIPREAWIPPAQHVDKMYTERSIEDMMNALTLEKKNASEMSASEAAKGPKKRKRRTKTPQPPLCDPTQRVPESFIDTLHEGAQLIPTLPKSLKLPAQMVITLDEYHRIQHMALHMQGFSPA